MRCVFDDFEVVTTGQAPHPRHIPDLASVVDGHNGGNRLPLGQRSLDLPFRIRNVEVEILDPAINQNGLGAKIAHHLSRRCKGHRRHDDALAGLQANGFERQVQCRGAGIDGNRVLLLEILAKLPLELLGLRPGGEPAALERLDHLADFLRSDAGFVKRDLHKKKQKLGKQPPPPARRLMVEETGLWSGQEPAIS